MITIPRRTIHHFLKESLTELYFEHNETLAKDIFRLGREHSDI